MTNDVKESQTPSSDGSLQGMGLRDVGRILASEGYPITEIATLDGRDREIDLGTQDLVTVFCPSGGGFPLVRRWGSDDHDGIVEEVAVSTPSDLFGTLARLGATKASIFRPAVSGEDREIEIVSGTPDDEDEDEDEDDDVLNTPHL